MKRTKVRTWLMGLLAALVVAVLVGVRPADEPVFAMQEREEAQAGGEQAKVLRFTITDFDKEPKRKTLPDGKVVQGYDLVEKDVLDLTVALPLVEFVLLSGIEAWPEVKKFLEERIDADEEAILILKLIDGINAERIQAFINFLKESPPGTDIFTLQKEEDGRIRLWVE